MLIQNKLLNTSKPNLVLITMFNIYLIKILLALRFYPEIIGVCLFESSWILFTIQIVFWWRNDCVCVCFLIFIIQRRTNWNNITNYAKEKEFFWHKEIFWFVILQVSVTISIYDTTSSGYNSKAEKKNSLLS